MSEHTERNPRWFIDAIDARGGLAIATRRGNDLNSGIFSHSGASVFISAPTFVPEYVGSQSVGLALARTRGQAGLFLRGEEIPFDSLAAVAEFVRRSYVRGASGDGPDENGGSSPPPSPEDLPPDEPTEGLRGIEGGETIVDPVAALLAVGRTNLDFSAALNIGDSHPGMALPQPAGKTSKDDTSRRRLARGALRVLRELIRRRPNGPDQLNWITALDMMTRLLTRMAPLGLIMQEFNSSEDATRWLYGRIYPPEDKPDDDVFRFVREYVLHGRYRPARYWGEGWTTTDMFDDLTIFPVPPQTVPFAKDGQNLQALLSVATATPEQMLHPGKPALEQECAELALFAAACLNLGGERAPEIWHLDYNAQMEFADRLAGRAQTWLGENIPRLVYATKVESLIARASDIPA